MKPHFIKHFILQSTASATVVATLRTSMLLILEPKACGNLDAAYGLDHV